MAMVIGALKCLDGFLPSPMTTFSPKDWEPLGRVCLWAHPARLPGVPLMSVLRNLHKTSWLLLGFPCSDMCKNTIGLCAFALLIILVACEGKVRTQVVDFLPTMVVFLLDAPTRPETIGGHWGDTIGLRLESLAHDDVHPISERVLVAAMAETLGRFFLCTLLSAILEALERRLLTNNTPGVAHKREPSGAMNPGVTCLRRPFFGVCT
jgi:hypothetical protein